MVGLPYSQVIEKSWPARAGRLYLFCFQLNDRRAQFIVMSFVPVLKVEVAIANYTFAIKDVNCPFVVAPLRVEACISLCHLMVMVREQREFQAMVLGPFMMGEDVIAAYAEDHCAELIKV